MSRYHYKGCGCGCNNNGIPITNSNQTNRTIVVPVPGIKGDKGDKQITLYSKNLSSTNPPLLDQVINPIGWSTQPPPLEEGEYRWMITGIVNYDNTILVGNWSNPVTDLSVLEDDAELTEDIFI